MSAGINPSDIRRDLFTKGHITTVPVQTHSNWAGMHMNETDKGWEVLLYGHSNKVLCTINPDTGTTIGNVISQGNLTYNTSLINAIYDLTKIRITNNIKYIFCSPQANEHGAYEGLQFDKNGEVCNPRKQLQLRKSRKKIHREGYKEVEGVLQAAVALLPNNTRYRPEIETYHVNNMILDRFANTHNLNDYAISYAYESLKLGKDYNMDNYKDNLHEIATKLQGQMGPVTLDYMAMAISGYLYVGESKLGDKDE